MRTTTDESIAGNSSAVASEEARSSRQLKPGGCTAKWLLELLASPLGRELRRSGRAKSVACASIFLISLGVRALAWQDSYVELAQKGPWMLEHARHYKSEALRILHDGGILFPREPVDPGDARLILHPPGYSAFMAGIFAIFGESDSAVRIAQIMLDGLSAVMVLLIAARLFNLTIATLAALLVGLSPHFAHYSLWTSPDTLCVLPILLAMYLTIRTVERPRLVTIIAAGAMIGVSCWLRANALLLAPVLAVVLLLLVDHRKRFVYAGALVAATLFVVSPITFRNWVLFHHFIPISITGGENLVVGIADYDRDGRFGMPASDLDAAAKDALWHNRPDYAASPWLPDGVERDQARYTRGLEVIRGNPGWFLGVMARRAFFMLTYNDSRSAQWPFNTSRVPTVSAAPPPLHSPAGIGTNNADWSSAGSALLADGSLLSPRAQASLDDDNRLLIAGDTEEFGDQFASAPIAVQPNTDYLIRAELALDQGLAAVKVMSSERDRVLESAIISGHERRRRVRKLAENDESYTRVDPKDRMAVFDLVFASGDRRDVRFVVSNNGPAGALMRVDRLELFNLGATPYLWTGYPRVLLKGLQWTVFNTAAMLPLVAAGVLLLVLARRGRAIALLLTVPGYYLVAQSALSTEYRYILTIHNFLFVAAAVTLYCAGQLIKRGALSARRSMLH